MTFSAYIKKLKLTAFEIASAQILLKCNGKESMYEYLRGLEQKRKEAKNK